MILGTIGGLSLFLYGMHLMSDSLEFIISDRLKEKIVSYTSNKYKAIVWGMFITAFIHSSSALSVLLIGLLNNDLIPLENAIFMMMGADIGTTFTSQMIAFDIGEYSPILLMIGVILMFSRFERIGNVLIGLGLLFMGLDIMSYALLPIASSDTFRQLISTLNHPLLALLFGMIFTAMIQSSSASIGIMQALANQGIIPYRIAVYIVFGQNIGTCITSFLASLNSSIAAKKLAFFQAFFNIIGSIIFTILCIYTPLIDIVESHSSHISFAIANMHTLFNISSVIIALPFSRIIIKLINNLYIFRKEK